VYPETSEVFCIMRTVVQIPMVNTRLQTDKMFWKRFTLKTVMPSSWKITEV